MTVDRVKASSNYKNKYLPFHRNHGRSRLDNIDDRRGQNDLLTRWYSADEAVA